MITIKELTKAFGIFLIAIVVIYLLNRLGIVVFLIILLVSHFYWIYGIVKGKKRIKKKDFKTLIPYYIGVLLCSGIDMLSTKFFVLNEGLENEGNLILVHLYHRIGDYVFLVFPFCALSLAVIISVYYMKNGKTKVAKKFLKLIIILYVITVMYNIVV